MNFFMLILQSIYFFLPAYFANMAPVIVKRVPFLKYPIDFGKNVGKDRLFGSHKTFRGLFFGVLFGLMVSFMQYLIYVNNIGKNIAIVDYHNWLFIGFLLGFGAIFGDLTKSFFKRRLHIPSGKPFIPFDQLDFVIGALVFISFAVLVPWQIMATLLIVSFVLHIATNHLAFYTKVRNEKW